MQIQPDSRDMQTVLILSFAKTASFSTAYTLVTKIVEHSGGQKIEKFHGVRESESIVSNMNQTVNCELYQPIGK